MGAEEKQSQRFHPWCSFSLCLGGREGGTKLCVQISYLQRVSCKTVRFMVTTSHWDLQVDVLFGDKIIHVKEI